MPITASSSYFAGQKEESLAKQNEKSKNQQQSSSPNPHGIKSKSTRFLIGSDNKQIRDDTIECDSKFKRNSAKFVDMNKGQIGDKGT